MSNRRSTSPGLSEAVGSSKMISSASTRERLGDLDQLALRRREPPHLDVERQRVGSWPRAVQDCLPRPRRSAVGQPPGPAELGQEDVLEHGQVGGEASLLHHDGDAGVAAPRGSSAKRTGWPR